MPPPQAFPLSTYLRTTTIYLRPYSFFLLEHGPQSTHLVSVFHFNLDSGTWQPSVRPFSTCPQRFTFVGLLSPAVRTLCTVDYVPCLRPSPHHIALGSLALALLGSYDSTPHGPARHSGEARLLIGPSVRRGGTCCLSVTAMLVS